MRTEALDRATHWQQYTLNSPFCCFFDSRGAFSTHRLSLHVLFNGWNGSLLRHHQVGHLLRASQWRKGRNLIQESNNILLLLLLNNWSIIIIVSFSIIFCGLVQMQYAKNNISMKSYTTVKYFSKMLRWVEVTGREGWGGRIDTLCALAGTLLISTVCLSPLPWIRIIEDNKNTRFNCSQVAIGRFEFLSTARAFFFFC